MSASTARRLAITEANRDDETIDVVAFESNIRDYGVPNLTSEFFPAEDARIWPTGSARLPFMVFGYPSTHQQFEDVRIGTRSEEVQAVYDGATSSFHLHRVKTERPFDADGMSGGPVFYIGGIPGSYSVGFAGIVMRGGRQSDYLHFMAANFLLDMALETATVPWAKGEAGSARAGNAEKAFAV